MTHTAAMPTSVVGCDVGKASIVVFDSRTGIHGTIPNQPKALATFAVLAAPGADAVRPYLGRLLACLDAQVAAIEAAAQAGNVHPVGAAVGYR